MNATLTYPRGLRHPSWYVPLLLPVLPAVGAYGARDADQFTLLVGAIAMLGLGLFLSVGLGAFLDRASALVRKEAELLRPAWLLGLFTSQGGLTFGARGESQLLIVVALMVLALVASLSFGIEFQQRTLPSLLCAPIDRARIWRVKMSVLGAALLSLAAIFVISASLAVSSEFGLRDFGGLIAVAVGSAYVAWATVPLWTLWTRHLLGGLTFALAVPPLSVAVLGSLMDGILPSSENLQEGTLIALAAL
ncbi:MAG: ABC transporter permease, partial [Verrucomicrobiales bacterium]|nr:ABC transporter permease [Verrucomicrobiales bacterium]